MDSAVEKGAVVRSVYFGDRIAPYLPWYAVRFFSRSDRPIAVELLTVRTIRPKSLQLRAADPAVQLGMATVTGANKIENLKWLIEEKDISHKRPTVRTASICESHWLER